MTLVVGVREAFEFLKKIVAEVELDVAGHADDDPAREELENSVVGCFQDTPKTMARDL